VESIFVSTNKNIYENEKVVGVWRLLDSKRKVSNREKIVVPFLSSFYRKKKKNRFPIIKTQPNETKTAAKETDHRTNYKSQYFTFQLAYRSFI
jgi:hypothetical protein